MTTQELTVKQSMDQHGMASINFPEVFGQTAWEQACQEIKEFKASESFAEQKATFLEGTGGHGAKTFLIRLRPDQKTIWGDIATDSRLVGMAREYFMGNQPMLADFDVWHTEPMPDDRERVMSQDWHIDMEAQRFPRRIFKAFLYFNDVREGNGPLELWMSGSSLQKNGPMKICVPEGTMVLVDTGALLHRGGYCQEGSRTLALWYYTNGEAMTVPPLNVAKTMSA